MEDNSKYFLLLLLHIVSDKIYAKFNLNTNTMLYDEQHSLSRICECTRIVYVPLPLNHIHIYQNDSCWHIKHDIETQTVTIIGCGKLMYSPLRQTLMIIVTSEFGNVK